MYQHLIAMIAATIVLHGTLLGAEEDKPEVAAFSFREVKYFHRFTKDEMHEYTPAGQSDLAAWKEMITVHFYREAKDGEALAKLASGVVENYKAAKGMIIRTDSVPRTKDNEAEHLIVALFGRPEFLEATFARFRLHDGVGTSVIYSKRFYGKDVGDEMSAWLKMNGPDTEKALMKWDALPKVPAAKQKVSAE
jgi:hypothetical protein